MASGFFCRASPSWGRWLYEVGKSRHASDASSNASILGAAERSNCLSRCKSSMVAMRSDMGCASFRPKRISNTSRRSSSVLSHIAHKNKNRLLIRAVFYCDWYAVGMQFVYSTFNTIVTVPNTIVKTPIPPVTVQKICCAILSNLSSVRCIMVSNLSSTWFLNSFCPS